MPRDGSLASPTTEIPIDPVRSLEPQIDGVIDDPGRIEIDPVDAR